MKSIVVSRRVAARIKELRKTGKTGINLADKADRVIDRLASGAAQNSGDMVGTTTKYGEKRIKKCQKYDLGCGYRLVTVHHDETVFILFLGTHDTCQRWLQNSRLNHLIAGAGVSITIPDTNHIKENCQERTCEVIATEEEQANGLTDEDLRFVFSGIVRGMQKQGK